jgi:hypothetical protein
VAPGKYSCTVGSPFILKHNSQLIEEVSGDEQVKIDGRKGQLDLIILKYMARRLHLTLQQPDQREGLTLQGPVLYQLQERHGRNHRMVIYRQQELFLKLPLAFVGFISKRKRSLLPSIVEQIRQTDQKLVAELITAPSILSYSSLELPFGEWCNLVVLDDVSAKKQIKGTETHAYAAYHLAHAYYEWIRLHTGTMSEGLDHMEMRLLKTKYYTFHAGQQRPSIQELEYSMRR